MISISSKNIVVNFRQLSLFLLIIQSCGIRFFPGQGSLLLLVIIGLGIKYFRLVTKKDCVILFTILIYLVLLKLINTGFTIANLIFLFGTVFQVFLFLIAYRTSEKNDMLEEDIYKMLKFFFFHALLCFIFHLLLKGLFLPTVISGYPYKTFLFLFYVDKIGRTTGLFWEPGVLQLILNILLFMAILRNKSLLFLGLITVTILSTQSTTGFLILALNFVLFISRHINFRKPKAIFGLVLALGVGASVYSIVASNISNKFDATNTSGLIRYRDFLIGSQMILERPIIGHGIYDYTHLVNKNYVSDIESDLFSEIYLAGSGEMSGGYTNGLLALFTWFGLPVGIYIYYLFFNNNIFRKKRFYFFAIFTLSLVSEPISYTSFFLLFPLSSLLLKNKLNYNE